MKNLNVNLTAIRQEAINFAIQRQKEQENEGTALPAPTKRQSFVNRRKANENELDSHRNSRNFAHPTTTFQGKSFSLL